MNIFAYFLHKLYRKSSDITSKGTSHDTQNLLVIGNVDAINRHRHRMHGSAALQF